MSQNQVNQLAQPSPGLPLAKPPVIDISKLYVMYYREGLTPNLTKTFYCDGDLLAARERANLHCHKMNYRLAFVKPFLSNLDTEEERFAKPPIPRPLEVVMQQKDAV